uniref:Periplasmic heavy metal sensor n=1 Tax=candidate division WOR-3 bacterium TaxID=2052148 RepID=A0A7C4YI85_UNCW3
MKYLFLVFAFLPISVFSQEMMEENEIAMAPHGPMMMEMAEELGLGGELKAKVEDLWFQHQKEMLDARYQIEKKQMEIMELLRSDDFTIEKFQSKWKELQQLKNDMELKMLNFKISVYKLLPKEKAKDGRMWLFGGGEKKKIIKKFMEMREEKEIQEHKCPKEGGK